MGGPVADDRPLLVVVGNWTVDGSAVTTATVAATHLQWHARRPEMLDAALERAAPLLALLDRPGGITADEAT